MDSFCSRLYHRWPSKTAPLLARAAGVRSPGAGKGNAFVEGADSLRGAQLVARVETVALIAVPEKLREDEIRLSVHPGAEGLSPAQLLEFAGRAPCGQDLVALVSLGPVDSPDEVQIDEVRLDGNRLSLHVRVREFEGRLAANVRRLALVIVDLGDLPPGRYHCDVQVDRYVFTEYDHPQTATYRGSSSRHLHFDVAG